MIIHQEQEAPWTPLQLLGAGGVFLIIEDVFFVLFSTTVSDLQRSSPTGVHLLQSVNSLLFRSDTRSRVLATRKLVTEKDPVP